MHTRKRIHRQRQIYLQIPLQTLMQILKLLRPLRNPSHIPTQRYQIRGFQHLQSHFRFPILFSFNCLSNPQQLHYRISVLTNSPIGALVVS